MEVLRRDHNNKGLHALVRVTLARQPGRRAAKRISSTVSAARKGSIDAANKSQEVQGPTCQTGEVDCTSNTDADNENGGRLRPRVQAAQQSSEVLGAAWCSLTASTRNHVDKNTGNNSAWLSNKGGGGRSDGRRDKNGYAARTTDREKNATFVAIGNCGMDAENVTFFCPWYFQQLSIPSQI